MCLLYSPSRLLFFDQHRHHAHLFTKSDGLVDDCLMGVLSTHNLNNILFPDVTAKMHRQKTRNIARALTELAGQDGEGVGGKDAVFFGKLPHTLPNLLL